MLTTRIGSSTDLVIRRFIIKTDTGPVQTAVIYMEGLANAKDILESLLTDSKETNAFCQDSAANPLQVMKDSILKTGDLKDVFNFDTLLHAILSGDTAILVDGCPQGIVANTGEWKDRGYRSLPLNLSSEGHGKVSPKR